MTVEVVAVWVKVYVVEVKVEVVWVDEVFTENPTLSTVQRFLVRLVPLPCRHLKEVLSICYIQDLFFLDF